MQPIFSLFGYDVITCKSKQIIGCALFTRFFGNFRVFLDVPKYIDMFYYIKRDGQLFTLKTKKIVAYHL